MHTAGTSTLNYLAGARIALAGATDRGRQRTSNQDSFAIDEATGVAVVADGVGGERAGDVASAIVTRVVCDAVRKRLLAIAGNHVNAIRLREHELALIAQAALLDAHCEVLEAAKTTGQEGMASTAALVFVHAELATISWAGDSSVFLFRDGALKQLTRGHSLEEDLSGGRAASAGKRHKGPLTMVAGGAVDPFMPEVRHEPIRPGDILLLSSDGLTDMLQDRQVARIIDRHRASLDSAVAALVAAANDAGGEDNVTVALIAIHQAPAGIAAGQVDRHAPSLTARLLTQVRPAALALFVAGLASGSLLTLAVRRGLESALLTGTGSKPAEVRSEADPQPPKPQANQPSLGVPGSNRSAPTPATKSSSAATAAPLQEPTSQTPTVPETSDSVEERMPTAPAVLKEAHSPNCTKASPSTDAKESAAQEAASSASGNASPPTKSRRRENAGPSTEGRK